MGNRTTLLNWHDAIYRITRPTEFGDSPHSWEGITPASVTSTSFPLLSQVNLNNTPTWKDFAMVMGGAQTPFGIQQANAGGSLAAAPPANAGVRMDTHSQHFRVWGRTFGIYSGKNGRPISESKPLSDALFTYAKSTSRRLRGNPQNPGFSGHNEDARIRQWLRTEHGAFLTGYHHRTSGWQWLNGWHDSVPASAILQPGVYMAVVTTFLDNVGGWSDFVIAVTDQRGTHWLCRSWNGQNQQAWRGSNCLFFVDTPVRYSVINASNSNWFFHGALYRLTPERYWNPAAEDLPF